MCKLILSIIDISNGYQNRKHWKSIAESEIEIYIFYFYVNFNFIINNNEHINL